MSNTFTGAKSYDIIYQRGGWQGVYDLHYHRSPYYPLFNRVVRELKRHDCEKVLEVGCGVGGHVDDLPHPPLPTLMEKDPLDGL